MENEVLEKLIGTVEEVSFYNEDTGFCVAEINTGSEGVTVVGAVGEIAVGAEIECEGKWDMHPSFGRQFRASVVHQTLPEDVSGILRYLSSGIIRAVPAACAGGTQPVIKTSTANKAIIRLNIFNDIFFTNICII